METERTDYAVEIPQLGSLILTHDLDGELKRPEGLAAGQTGRTLPLVFWSFRIMVGLGLLMLRLGLAEPRRCAGGGQLYRPWWLHRFAVAMGPAGFVAVMAGWITTEVGRQPFTVYGLLRTADSVSPLARAGRGRLARRLRGGLLLGLRRRHLLHPAPDAPSRRTPASTDPPPASRSAPPASRPAAGGRSPAVPSPMPAE